MVDGAKMSKSAGTFFTIRDLIQRGASPAAIRLELIKTHYRVNSNFTLQGLRDAQRQIDRWAAARDWLEAHADGAGGEPGPLAGALPLFEEALCADLNVAGAMGILNTALAALPVGDTAGPGCDAAGELDALRRMDGVLGVLDLERTVNAGEDDVDESGILERIAARNRARDAKDWAEADRIRDELLESGIAIKDGAEGTTWSKVIQ